MIRQLYIGCVMTWVCFFYPAQACADAAIWQYATSRAAPVSDLAIDPANSETIYTAAGKIVFKSTDGGDSWEPVFSAHDYGLRFVKCSGTEPGTVYAGGPTYVFKSTDSGKNWTLIFEGSPYSIDRFVVADAMPQRLYLVIHSHQGGFFRSDDGGANWTLLLDMSRFPVADIAVSNVDADLIFFSSPTRDGFQLFKSEDGGETQRKLNSDLYPEWPVHLATHPTKRDAVYILFNNDDAGAIASSRDGGETWTVSDVDDGRWHEKAGVWLDPFHPNVLYAGTYQTIILKPREVGNRVIYRSINDGVTW